MLRYYDFTEHGSTAPTKEDETHVSPLHEIVGWVKLFGRTCSPETALRPLVAPGPEGLCVAR
jgi:hypothetical protein